MFTRFFRRRRPKLNYFAARRSSKKPQGLIIRKYCPSDFSTCLQLYKDNETGRFPANTVGMYAATLERQEALVLMVEWHGEVVGTAGIYSQCQGSLFYYWLTFGLVAPQHQRGGIGTVLLLARIALLPDPDVAWPVLLTAVAKSRSFYEQFGFGRFADDSYNDPHVVGCFIANVQRKQIRKSRAYLHTMGIDIHEGSYHIEYKPVEAEAKVSFLGEI